MFAFFLPLRLPYVTIPPPAWAIDVSGIPAQLSAGTSVKGKGIVDELTVRVGAATDTGPVREQNEDAVLISEPDPQMLDTNGLLLAVADGMGGYQRGEVASRIAVETVREIYYESALGENEIPDRLKRAFRTANERIFNDGSAEGQQNMMGTTLVAAVIKDNDLTLANVGDSRAYLVRANRANQVTQDHSLVAEQVAAGAMTAEEARESQHRNIITRALGHRDRVDVDIFEIRLLGDDRLVLTSDGLHDYVTDDELAKIPIAKPADEAARELIALAIENQTNDNVSVLVASFTEAGVAVAAEAAEEEPAERSSMLVPVLVLIGLMIFIAIVIVILQMG
jgi:PPM family protein phosphatase